MIRRVTARRPKAWIWLIVAVLVGGASLFVILPRRSGAVVELEATTSGDGGASGIELYEYAPGRTRQTTATGVTVCRFSTGTVQWWPDTMAGFWYEQQIADYLLAGYLARHELLVASRRAGHGSSDRVSWIKLVDLALSLIDVCYTGNPISAVAAIMRLNQLHDAKDEVDDREAARDYLKLNAEIRRSGSGDREVVVSSGDGTTLRVARVRRFGKAVLSDGQLAGLVRQLCPDADSQDLNAWRAVLGDGYIVTAYDEPAYHRTAVKRRARTVRSIADDRFVPPTRLTFVRNDGEAKVASWEPFLLDGSDGIIRSIDVAAPHRIAGGCTVTSVDGDLCFLLQTKIAFVSPLGSDRVEVSREVVTLRQGEIRRCTLDMPLPPVFHTTPLGWLYLEVYIDGERLATTPVTGRFVCTVI